MKQILTALMIIGIVFAQSFTNNVAKPPTLVKQVQITLLSTDNEGIEEQGINYLVYLYDEDGTMLKPVQGNLLPFMTQAEITGLKNFLDKMVLKANTELIP